MREVRSQHWLCGTEVTELVADDYDLSDGLALVCPVCKDVWWHYPETDASPQTVRASDERPREPEPAPIEDLPPEPPWERLPPSRWAGDADDFEPAAERKKPPGASAARVDEAAYADEDEFELESAPASPRHSRRPDETLPPGEIWDESYARMGWDDDAGGVRRRGQPAVGVGPTRSGPRAGGRPPPPRPSDADPVLARGWIGPALVLAGLALVLLRVADLGPHKSAPARTTTAARPAAAPPATPTTTAPAGGSTGTSSPTVVNGVAFSLRKPARWVVYRSGSAEAVAPARGAPESVLVYVAKRPELTLDRMAVLAANSLEGSFGAPVKGPSPVRIGGRRGLRLSGSRGKSLREMTVVAAGPYRYVIELRVRAGAKRTQIRLARRTIASFRASP